MGRLQETIENLWAEVGSDGKLIMDGDRPMAANSGSTTQGGTPADDVPQTTSYVYDAQGNTTVTTYADGSFTEAAYNGLGQKIGDTGQLAKGTAVEWSASDNSFIVPGGGPTVLVPTTSYAYDDWGRLTDVWLATVLNPLVLTAGEPTPTRPHYHYGYDAYGNQTLTIDPNLHDTEYTFDCEGHQLTHSLPLAFGPNGQPTSTGQLPAGFTEQTVYDAHGRLSYEVSVEGVVTAYVYDDADPGADGRLVETEYFNTLADYEQYLGSPGVPGDPTKLAEATMYGYDAFGHQTVVDQYSYDAGTPTLTQWTNSAYDADGNLIMVDSTQGTVHYEFDPVTGEHTRTYTDVAGNSTSAGGAVTDTRYEYDTLGRLIEVDAVARNGLVIDEVTRYSYDLLGNLLEEDLPNNVVNDYTYDSLNRLTDLRSSNAATDQAMAEYIYGLNADGTRKDVTEDLYYADMPGGSVSDHHTTIGWVYDALGRLTEEDYDSYDGNVSVLSFTADYTLDLVGNRVTMQKGSRTTTDFYDANDRLLTETQVDSADPAKDQYTVYTYGPNADLNAAGGPYGGDGTQQASETVYQGPNATGTVLEQDTYGYNLQGQMSSSLVDLTGSGGKATRSSYTYDADGTRVSQTVTTAATVAGLNTATPATTSYLNDTQNPTGYTQVIEELSGPGNSGGIQKSYTIGLNVISQYTNGSYSGVTGTSFLLYDGHGSTRELLDSNGHIGADLSGTLQIYRYDAFGNAIGFDPTKALTDILYDAQRTDVTGLQFLRARYYDLRTGRFTSLDSYAGSASDPLSYNKYVFCRGNPLNLTDPTGLNAQMAPTPGLWGLLGGTLGGLSLNYGTAAVALGAGVGIGAAIYGMYAAYNAMLSAQVALATATAGATDYLYKQAELTAEHPEAVAAAISAAIASAAAGAAEAADALRRLKLPTFFVVRSWTPQIYDFDVQCLASNPAWFLLNYNGPYSPQTAANRVYVNQMWGNLRAGALAGYELDEFPFASTAEGGAAPPGASARMVPRWENRAQGGYLKTFYARELNQLPAPFLVVPLPL